MVARHRVLEESRQPSVGLYRDARSIPADALSADRSALVGRQGPGRPFFVEGEVHRPHVRIDILKPAVQADREKSCSVRLEPRHVVSLAGITPKVAGLGRSVLVSPNQLPLAHANCRAQRSAPGCRSAGSARKSARARRPPPSGGVPSFGRLRAAAGLEDRRSGGGLGRNRRSSRDSSRPCPALRRPGPDDHRFRNPAFVHPAHSPSQRQVRRRGSLGRAQTSVVRHEHDDRPVSRKPNSRQTSRANAVREIRPASPSSTCKVAMAAALERVSAMQCWLIMHYRCHDGPLPVNFFDPGHGQGAGDEAPTRMHPPRKRRSIRWDSPRPEARSRLRSPALWRQFTTTRVDSLPMTGWNGGAWFRCSVLRLPPSRDTTGC